MSKSKVSPEVRRLLRSAISLFSIEHGTLGVHGNKRTLEFSRLSYLLGEELRNGSLDSDKHSFLWAALFEMAPKRTASWKVLELTIDRLRREARAKPKIPFTVVLATNIRRKNVRSAAEFQVGDCKSSLVEYEDLPKALRDSIENNRPKYKSEWPSKFCSFALIPYRAATAKEAWIRAYNVFEALRSALNYESEYGKRRLAWNRILAPLSPYLPTPFMYVLSDTDDVVLGPVPRNLPPYWREQEATSGSFRYAKWVLKLLYGAPNPVRSIVADAMLRYSQALDHREHWQQFLGFWQILELLSRTQRRMKDDEVIERITAMVEHYPKMPPLVKAIHRKRNSLVHDGAYDLIQDDDVVWCRALVEICMEFYLQSEKSLKRVEDLDTFFRYRGARHDQLKGYRRVADLLVRKTTRRKPS